MTIAFEITLIIVMLACVLFLFGDQHRFRIEHAIIFMAAAAAMLALLLAPQLL